MKKLIHLSTFLLAGWLAVPTYANIDALNWQLKKSDPHIDVYSAKVPGSRHKAILSVTTIKASPMDIIQILRNPTSCTQWVYRCKSSYKHQTINAQEEYIYTSTKMPFPLKDRDILAHISWTIDPKTEVITATGVATSDIVKARKSYKRIVDANMIWEIIPLSDSETQIRNYGHIDPAGNIPAWLSNSMSVNIPFTTLSKLRHLLEDS